MCRDIYVRCMCRFLRLKETLMDLLLTRHPGGNPGADLNLITHKCYFREVAFEWELIKETIFLPLGCIQGGQDPVLTPPRPCALL